MATGYIQMFKEAQAKNEARVQERLDAAMKIYDERISMYRPGGEFGKGVEAQIGKAKKTSIASGMQHLASAGLYNTSIGAGLGTKFEQEVGSQARLNLQDMRMGRLSSALGDKAGVLERIEDVGPDLGQFASLMSAASNRPSSGGYTSAIPNSVASGMGISTGGVSKGRETDHLAAFRQKYGSGGKTINMTGFGDRRGRF